MTAPITAANVQAVADNLTTPAREMGLIREDQRIATFPGSGGMGVPWEARVTLANGHGAERASFLPRTLGTTAAEAHAKLTAALIALRAASEADRARLLRALDDDPQRFVQGDREAFFSGEISARALQRRHNAPKEAAQ